MRRRRPEGPLDAITDALLDRTDDMLEPLVRRFTGKSVWDEMKENGLLATHKEGQTGRVVLKHLARLMEREQVEIHLVGHSAGSIFLAPFVQLLATSGEIKQGSMKGKTGYGIPAATCTLWAPAMTMALFKETYGSLIKAQAITRFALYTLTEKFEQDDHCAQIYRKSLLYLVSNALEETIHIPLIQPDGEPLLGMEKFVQKDETLPALFQAGQADWVLAPNQAHNNSLMASEARSHGGFDNDPTTLRSTMARILGRKLTQPDFSFSPSATNLQQKRRTLFTAS